MVNLTFSGVTFPENAGWLWMAWMAPEVVDLDLFLSLAPHATGTTGAPSGGCVPGSTRRCPIRFLSKGVGSTTK